MSCDSEEFYNRVSNADKQALEKLASCPKKTFKPMVKNCKTAQTKGKNERD